MVKPLCTVTLYCEKESWTRLYLSYITDGIFKGSILIEFDVTFWSSFCCLKLYCYDVTVTSPYGGHLCKTYINSSSSHHEEKPWQAAAKSLLWRWVPGTPSYSCRILTLSLLVFLASVSLVENDGVRINKLQDYFQLQLSPVWWSLRPFGRNYCLGWRFIYLIVNVKSSVRHEWPHFAVFSQYVFMESNWE